MLRELREDTVHGASWYFLKGIELVSLALSNGFDPGRIRALINELRGIRPGMVPIINLAYIIEQAIDRGLSISDVINKLRETYSRVRERMVEQLSKYTIRCGSGVITISYSSAVRTALERWGSCFDLLIIMESRPGNEVFQAVRDYSRFVSTIKVIPDSAVASFIKRGVDYVVVGTDGLYTDGYFLNKVGTETLLITAREFGVKTIVIAESYKAAVGGVDEVYTVDFTVGGVITEVPLFDKVPLDLVDYLITDVGIIKRPRAEDVGNIRRAFIESVLGPGG